MKTTINRHRVGTIKEFADEFGLEMVVEETNAPADSDKRYKAGFTNGLLWIRVADMLLPSTAKGFGNTPEVAIAHYARRISGEQFVRESDSKTIQVWRLDEKPAEKPTHTFENEMPQITIEATDKGFLERLTAFLVIEMAKGTGTESELEPQPEIAPCPLCGGKAIVRRDEDYWVECIRTECIRSHEIYDTEAEAIAAWYKLAGRE